MNESRLRRSGRNIIAGLFQYALNILLVWIGRIIFVNVLSSEYLGINGLFTNIISVLSIADLGLPAAMTYSLYQPLADNDTKKITSLIAFFRNVYIVIAIAVFAIGMSLIPFLDKIVNLETPIQDIEKYYILILLNTVISYVYIYRTTLFTADQKNYILQRYIMIFRVITFVAQTIVLLLFHDYFFYLFVSVFVALLSNLFQNRASVREYPYLTDKAAPLSLSERKKIWCNVFDLFLYRICGVIQNNTDSILISLFAGTIIVGYYSNYQLIILTLVSILTIVFSGVKASLGNLIFSEAADPSQKQEVYWTMELVNYWMVSFCSICLICLFQGFIELSFGEEYLLSFGTVVVIVLNFYTGNIRQPIWAFRETTGIFHETRNVTAVTAVINVILSLLLGYYSGIFGILISTVIARMVYSWWKEPMVLFNGYFGCSSKKYFVNYLIRFVLFVIVCSVCCFLCEMISLSNVYVCFVLKMLCCLLFPNTVYAVCFFKDKGLRRLIKRLIH